MSKNVSSMSACAFDLVLSNVPSSLWDARDVASLLSVKPGAAAHMAGHLDLKVVLKSADSAGAFASWLKRHAGLLDSLQINSASGWWPAWLSFKKYGNHGGIPVYSAEHEAAAKSLTAALKAAGSSGSLVHLRSFSCMHVVPTEQLLQVLPISLTQLRLSYETDALGDDPCDSDDDMDEDAGDSSDEDAGGPMRQQQCAHIRPKRWHDWAKPLVAGLARLTGLRSLTLDVDISQDLCHGYVNNVDNSAILCAVRPLTQLTELILPNSRYEDLQATIASLSQLPISLQSFAVYESRTGRAYGGDTTASLSHLSALTRLDLGDCFISTGGNFQPADRPVLPTSLRHISCTTKREYRVANMCELAVLKTLTQLEHLESRYSAASLADLAACLTRLTHVEMGYALCKPEVHEHSDGDEDSEEGEQAERDGHGEPVEEIDEPTFGLSTAVARLAAGGVADAVRTVTLRGESYHRGGIVAGPEVLQQLAGLPNLCGLSLSHSLTVSDDGLFALSCLTGLTTLDMHGYEFSKHQMLQVLPDVVEQLPSLRRLVVPNSYTVQGLLSTAEQQAFKDRLTGMTCLSCIGW